jgi:hypothetical protein
MSTRANVILKETYKDSFGNEKSEELFFYRHSDGYPEVTLQSLNIFMDWLKTKKIRNNLAQSAGWLVILGAIEYNSVPKFKTEEPAFKGAKGYGDITTIEMPEDDGSTWKVGAYEPTTSIHGDIEYLYTINLTTKTLTYKKV